MEILVAFVRDWVVSLGQDECGGIVEGIVYHVIVEDDMGARWAHHKAFASHEAATTPEGFTCARHIEGAPEKAERLANRVDAAGVIDLEFWEPVEPRYGSPAFMNVNAYGGDQYV